MKRSALTILILVCPLILYAANWDRYQVRTIGEETSRLSPKAAGTIIVSETSIRARVLYKESGRAIEKKKRQFIADWLRKQNLPKEHLELFGSEIQVFEGNRSYWIPIQEGLMDALWKDHGKFPAQIDVYVVLIGFISGEPVMLLNRYDMVSN